MKKKGLVVTLILILSMVMAMFTGCDTPKDDGKGDGGSVEPPKKPFTQEEMNAKGNDALLKGLMGMITGAEINLSGSIKTEGIVVGELENTTVKFKIKQMPFAAQSELPEMNLFDMLDVSVKGGVSSVVLGVPTINFELTLVSGTIYVNVDNQKLSMEGADIMDIIMMISAIAQMPSTEISAETLLLSALAEDETPTIEDILGDINYDEKDNVATIGLKIALDDLGAIGEKLEIAIKMDMIGENYKFNSIDINHKVEGVEIAFAASFTYPTISITAPTDAANYASISALYQGIKNLTTLEYLDLDAAIVVKTNDGSAEKEAGGTYSKLQLDLLSGNGYYEASLKSEGEIINTKTTWFENGIVYNDDAEAKTKRNVEALADSSQIFFVLSDIVNFPMIDAFGGEGGVGLPEIEITPEMLLSMFKGITYTNLTGGNGTKLEITLDLSPLFDGMGLGELGIPYAKETKLALTTTKATDNKYYLTNFTFSGLGFEFINFNFDVTIDPMATLPVGGVPKLTTEQKALFTQYIPEPAAAFAA